MLPNDIGLVDAAIFNRDRGQVAECLEYARAMLATSMCTLNDLLRSQQAENEDCETVSFCCVNKPPTAGSKYDVECLRFCFSSSWSRCPFEGSAQGSACRSVPYVCAWKSDLPICTGEVSTAITFAQERIETLEFTISQIWARTLRNLVSAC